MAEHSIGRAQVFVKKLHFVLHLRLVVRVFKQKKTVALVVRGNLLLETFEKLGFDVLLERLAVRSEDFRPQHEGALAGFDIGD